ncbi:MAG: 5-(carboxyamino)imidazole ribonucleotide synthase [Bacilli bacterium]|nr:5-(carboxyamino)imidazole ribonucleotide synthase [Bacilli bacterium]
MKIGIIGGGQLGLMIAQAAKELGHIIYSLDSNDECPIKSVTDYHIVAAFDDVNAINELIKISDVVTYEFENIILDKIIDSEKKIIQGLKALKISQNRLLEKDTIAKMNIKTPKYTSFEMKKKMKYPSIVKSKTGGYDGKNQYIIKSDQDIDRIQIDNPENYIIEEYINFDYEISVLCTRDIFNTTVVFPIPINHHKNGILFTSIVDGSIPKEIIDKAVEKSRTIVEKLDYVGTMAIEYFVVGNDILFNEFAPRPHNSGHYTIEACNVSQFHNHVLAITGNPIIEPILVHKSIMLNILGQNLCYIKNSYNYDEAYLHLYGKKEYNNNRKIGHITIIAENNLSILDEITKE